MFGGLANHTVQCEEEIEQGLDTARVVTMAGADAADLGCGEDRVEVRRRGVVLEGERTPELQSDSTAEASQGAFAVAVLGAGLLAQRDDARGTVGESDGGVGLVAVLAAWAGDTEGLDAALLEEGGVAEREIVGGGLRGHHVVQGFRDVRPEERSGP